MTTSVGRANSSHRGDRDGCAPTSAGGSRGPLAGLRVVDMSTVLAGPNAARYLADFGADVIKVERPGGDGLRDMAWRDPRDDVGLWWKVVNRNKRAVVLDVKHEADRDVLLGLLDEADVFVENSRPGTLERLGFGTRRAARPQRRARDHPGHGLRSGRSVRVPARLRHDRRGDVGPGVAQRRARRPAAAPADRAHRRGHRPGGGVRHDGRAAFGRRAGRSTSTCWRRCSS